MKDTMKVAYLYEEGFAIEVYERYQPDIRTYTEYAKLVTGLPKLNLPGRLVFHSTHIYGWYNLAKKAVIITVRPPEISKGSPKSINMGLAFGGVDLEIPKIGTICIDGLPDIVALPVIYQSDVSCSLEKMKTQSLWVDMPLIKEVIK